MMAFYADRVKRSQAVPCPKCLADVGSPCVTKVGKAYRSFAHKPRIYLAYHEAEAKRAGVEVTA